MANFLINSASSNTVGTNSPDLFSVSNLQAVSLQGLDGADTVSAAYASEASSTFFQAGAGNDTVTVSGAGINTSNFYVGADNDQLNLHSTISGVVARGGSGNDSITFSGNAVASTVNGNDNSDIISASFLVGAEASGFFIGGGKGADTIEVDLATAANAFTINGGAGHDFVHLSSVSGIASGFTINGGAGFDTITIDTAATTGMRGAFTIDAGSQADLVTVLGAVSAVSATINLGDGADTISFSAAYDNNAGTLNAGAGADSIQFFAAVTDGSVYGGDGIDSITLSSFGGATDSGVLFGGNGADILSLGSGLFEVSATAGTSIAGGSLVGYSTFEESNLSAYDVVSAGFVWNLDASSKSETTVGSAQLFKFKQDVVSASLFNGGNNAQFTATNSVATFTSTFATNLTSRVDSLNTYTTEGHAIYFTDGTGNKDYLFIQGGDTSSSSDDLVVELNTAIGSVTIAGGTAITLNISTSF